MSLLFLYQLHCLGAIGCLYTQQIHSWRKTVGIDNELFFVGCLLQYFTPTDVKDRERLYVIRSLNGQAIANRIAVIRQQGFGCF
ncbi:MAG: hypothetical protein VX027_02960 [Bacteroidota bacterium]|nr:hypothetical protein [Bacteroidota bacterium]